MTGNAKSSKYTTSQLFNFAPNSYLERTSRPIYAVFFLLPFIVFYELGIILINTGALNKAISGLEGSVVSFIWIKNIFHLSNRVAWFGIPLVVVIILLALQITSHKRWFFLAKDVLPMSIECIILALPLITISLVLNRPMISQSRASIDAVAKVQIQSPEKTSLPASVDQVDVLQGASNMEYEDSVNRKSLLAQLVTGIGAGIYEELVFRLILICLLMLIFQDLLALPHKNSVVLAVVISAVFFSLHHHVYLLNGHIEAGEPFHWLPFVFRSLAGIYFAALFAVRGFAITAGTHAFYNIIALVLNCALSR